MVFNRRKVFILVFLICLLAAGLVWFRSYMFSSLAAGLNQRIDSLKVSGLTVTYDSLSVNWRTNVIEVDGVLIEKNAYDTTCVYPEFIKIAKVRAKGWRLIPLILHNTLSFENILLEEAHAVVRPNSLISRDSLRGNSKRLAFEADRISFRSAHLEYLDSAACNNLFSLKGDIALEHLAMDPGTRQPLDWKRLRVNVGHVQVRMMKAPYTYDVRQASADFANELLVVDTVRIIPDFGKLQYGRRYGYEVDRIEGIVPFVRVSRFRMALPGPLQLSAAEAEVQFYLKIFRDKRLPFRRKKKSLPVALLQALPLHLRIDTVKVIKSYVQYEEMYADAEGPGKVYFDDLEAAFSDVDNRATDRPMKLEARALLMGEGKVSVSGVFPITGKKRSTIRGSVQDFSIPKINAMLVPATNLKVESGTMDNLLFSFAYSEWTSTGEVELNYRDLKLVTFKDGEKDADGKRQKDNLKTFMMNTFVFKKKMDEKVPEEKRTGTISYARDDARSVFNYWLKSVLSGIKSAYDLDKMEAKKSRRELKKEERLARREARRLRKAKNKDRG